MQVCLDFDDYYDQTVVELDFVKQLKLATPQLKVTLFAIPDRCSEYTVKAAKHLDKELGGGWLQLAPHGWRHSRFECLAWNDDELVSKVHSAAKKGIDAPVFRAPGWMCDKQPYLGCAEAGYVVAGHREHHVHDTGARVYLYNKPPKDVLAVHGHLTNTPAVTNYIRDMKFPEWGKMGFVWPQEIV